MEFNIFYIKALHIIFIVTWFAGLFYAVRLFIYHTEAESKDEPDRTILQRQYKIMEKRLWYGITWPSAILTFILGFWLVAYHNLWAQSWMLLKFGLVAGLFLYHCLCHMLFKQLQRNIIKYTSFKLRLWNEVATLFLVSVVFVIVLRDALSWIWGLVGLALFSAILMLAIRIYKKQRLAKASEKEEEA